MRVLAGLMMALCGGWCLGEEWERESFVLAPEVEERWAGWMEGAQPLRVKKETERMAGVIEELRKAHGLNVGAVAELKAVVPGLVEETVRDWEQFLRQIYRPTFQGTAKEGLEGMGVIQQEPVTMMAGHEIAFYLLPQERAAFVSAVKRVLPGEVFEVWEAGRVKRGEERKKQARSLVEAGILERKPAKIYANELAKAVEGGLAVLGKDSAEGKAMVKQVEVWAAAYEEVCREMSVLKADSFVLTGQGWRNVTAQGWHLFLPRRTGVINAHREKLKEMTMAGGGGAQLAALAKRWEPEDFKLDSMVDLAWEANMREARVLHLKKREEKFLKEVVRLQEGYGLSESGAVRLREVEPELAKAAMPFWEQSMRTLFRQVLVGKPEQALEMLKSRYGPGVLAGFPAPVHQETVNSEAWEKLLKRELDGDAFAKWLKDRDEGLKKRTEEMRVLVAAGRERFEPEKLFAKAFDEVLSVEMLEVAGEAEWRKKWEEAVKGYAKDYVEACVQRSVDGLEARDALGGTWETARKNGNYFQALPLEPWVERYRDELMKLVPAEAKVAHERLVKEREAWTKGVVVRARVMIVEQMVPLDAAQLKAVRELAEALPIEAGESLLNPEVDPEHWKVWKGAEGARRLNEILDDRQERMVAKGVARFEKGNSGMGSSQEVAPEVLRHPALGAEDPEAVEELVSEYLAENSQEHAMKGLESIMRDVDAVVRVLGLDEGVRAELELGAKGTVQAAAEAYRVNQGRWVRSQTQGATTATIRNWLKNLGGYTFHFGNEGNTTVEEVLNEVIDAKQREVVLAYQDEVKGRRDEAIAEVALGRLQMALGLNTAQREKLRKLLVGVMAKYGPDIETNFRSWGERMPWYLQSYYLMLPGAGVEEGELKGLLNERQREIWDEQVTERGGHYWGQILEYHERRVQSKGERLANRRILFQQ